MLHTTLPIFRFVAVILLCCVWSRSRADITEVDLNGFRLQQLLTVVEPSLGQPFNTSDEGDLVVNAYSIDRDAYMAVGHSKKHPHNIALLQLTGMTKKAIPFRGLVLGDSRRKVVEVLGKPDHVEHVQSPNLTVLSYEGRNYTVEIDDKDRLYSIQIFTTSDLMNATDGTDNEWKDFKAAVLSKNIVALMQMMKPDVEIYRAGKTLSIDSPFKNFIASPNKEFVSSLIGQNNSVLRELAATEPVQEFRLTEKIGIGIVYKFPKGKILEEIVFFPFAGKYRVYEIAFRGNAE